MKHQFSQKITPRFQDADTEVRYVKDGFVRYASNGRIARRGVKKGAWINIKGTLLVPNRFLPAGVNKNLGCCSNKAGSFLLFLNWNSNNESGIYMYNPALDEPLQLLIKDTNDNIILGFHQYFNIKGTKATIINDKYFSWTDKYNAPRMIDIDWALDYKKKKIWEIQQVDSNITNFNVLNFKFNGVSVSLFTNNNGTLLLSNPKLYDYFDVEDCDCSITLTEKVWGTCELTTASTHIRIVPQNFYPKPHNERQIDLVLYPPSTAPTVVLKRDRKNKRNFLSGNSWQFRYQYIYKDGNYSVWSAWSKSVNTSGDCASQYNVIEIDYTDKIFDCLNDPTQLHLIDKVVIGYRNTNTGALYSFITVKQCDIPKIKQTYNFYNDLSASAVSEYNNLKQYDTVPLQCGTLNTASNRILTGDVVENYDEGECFDFDVDVLYNTEQKSQFTGKIECDIHIRSFNNGDYLMPIMQMQEESDVSYWGGISLTGFGGLPMPLNETMTELDLFDQRLARRGFTGYIAGTDISALSVQINTSLRKIGDSNIVKIVTDGDYADLRDILEDTPNKFIQRLTFDGLADGKYIIRLASHWCWKDKDVLGKGDAYNMDNGLQYQKTSTNIYSINGDINAREIEVEIINGIQQGSNPIIEVEDTTRTSDRTSGLENMTLIQGYLIDERDSDQDKIYSGIRVEKSATGMYALTPTTGQETDGKYYTLTDHNGYFYGRFEANTGSGINRNKFKILSAKDRNRNWNVLPGFTGEPAFVWNNDTILKGNLSELKAGTCSSETNNDYRIDSGRVTNFIIYNVTANGENISNNFRTLIKGKIVDVDGNGISGVTVVASETSRFDKTDENGDFSILLYTNLAENRADKRSVRLIAFGNSCFTGFVFRDFTITLGSAQYNNTKPYSAGNIMIQITDNDLQSTYYLKNGDTYDIGVTLMDRALRKTTVISNEKKHTIRLPFTTEYIQDYFPNITTDTSGNPITPTTKANGFFTLKIKPKSIPTIWQTHLYTLRTDGQVYADYIQFVVSEVKYVINYATTTDPDGKVVPDPVYTTYAANDANEIYLDMVTSFVQYKDRNSNSVKGWTVEKGDRLRFIYKKDGTLRDFVEVEIREQRGNYFVIPVIESLDEILQGEVVEIFRLKTKLEKKNFYETGEYIKVLNPYTDIRSFEVSELLLNTGDAYRRNRKMYALSSEDGATPLTVTRRIEDMTPNDTVLEKDNDRGRLDFINDFYKQVRRQATIRFGDTILLDSNLNNIRRFNAEQQVTANYNDGAIAILDSFDNLLFVAQESKCHTRLIGKTTAYLGDGQQLQFDADSFLAKPYYLNGVVGCQNPESYATVDNSGIFFDTSGGVVMKYSPQNGLTNISGFDDQYNTSKYQESIFIPLAQKLNLIPKDLYNYLCQINGTFNDFEKEYNIGVLPINIGQGDNISAFSGTRLNSNIGENDVKFKVFTTSPISILVDGFTMANDTESGFWFGHRTYNPESYGNLKNRYFGFKDGVMHEMEKGIDYNKFFGVQEKSKVWVMMNVNPSDMKFFTNWSVESNEKWTNPYVKVDNSRAFRTIESRTPDASIIKQNGVFYSAFSFDLNTPNVVNPLINGNKLCGETLIMHLENDSNTEVVLFAVNIYAGLIRRTNF